MQLDKRTREDIIRELEELAASYTPEWKFRSSQGDAGSALLNIYGDMLVEMLRRYNRIPERDKQLFFQMLGTRQRPAEPARGYVSFGLNHPEAEGTLVPAGTGLWGRAEDGGQIRLETGKEVYISNSRMETILYQDGAEDWIYCLAEGEGSLDDSCSENLQEHVCRLGHSVVFHIKGEAEVLISFQSRRGSLSWDTLIEDKEKTSFSYSSRQGEWRFQEWSCESNTIRLKKAKEMPDFADIEGIDEGRCVVRWKAEDIQAYAGLEITNIRIGAIGSVISPDYAYTAEGQEAVRWFFPFGERPYSFGECYICSNEVFEKMGAWIHLTLKIEFRKMPLLREPMPLPIHWKTIMKESDFPKVEELPVAIGEVVWEYYNGTGFTRLFSEPLYGDMFTPDLQACTGSEPAVRTGRISFLCPEDITPFLVNAEAVYCIRIRILHMQNEYAAWGYYVSPFITHMEAFYDYSASMVTPEVCRCRNNLEEHGMTEGQPLIPFLPAEEQQRGIYIGLTRPLSGGPYGIYCGIKPRDNFREKKWNYEYYNGREWISLALEDETENLTKSGSLMVFGNYHFSRTCFFGRELYWMRMIQVQDGRETEAGYGTIPIQEIWMNTVPVVAAEQAPEEYLTVSGAEAYPSCRLMHKNIQQIQIWVNEADLSEEEQEKLEQETEICRVRNEAGVLSQVWVQWKETGDIRQVEPGSRLYSVERRDGILQFSCGRQGFFPGNRNENQIKAVYTWGGGSQGNLAAGQVTHLSRSIRMVNQVVNRHSLSGGRDEELPEETMTRMEYRLAHRNRAVLSSDYEALARESTRKAVRVKAFSNRNGIGELQRGAVTLVVLQEEYQKGEFHIIRETIQEYIESRMPAILQVQKHLYIVEPWFTEVQVAAVCRIKQGASVFSCKAEAEERLGRFLDPLTGNFDGKGWKIGQAPRREQIRNVLSKTKGIRLLQRMVVKAYCIRNGRIQEVNLEGKLPDFIMVINGSHRLQMEFFYGETEGEHRL